MAAAGDDSRRLPSPQKTFLVADSRADKKGACPAAEFTLFMQTTLHDLYGSKHNKKRVGTLYPKVHRQVSFFQCCYCCTCVRMKFKMPRSTSYLNAEQSIFSDEHCNAQMAPAAFANDALWYTVVVMFRSSNWLSTSMKN